MTPQLATKARPSATVDGIGIVIIMSSPRRLDRTTDTQATAAMRRSTIEVRIVTRSRTGIGSSPGPTRQSTFRERLDAEAGGADPARLRDVDGDAVGADVLHLDVAVRLPAVTHPEGLVDVVARLGSR